MLAPNIILVSMPWGAVAEPSLGLAILKSRLKEYSIKSLVYHANIFLLHYITIETYVLLSRMWGINEFLFTSILDGKHIDKNQSEVLKELCNNPEIYHTKYKNSEEIKELILTLRDKIIPKYLNDCANYILEKKPTMIGFTCMFDQTIASIALSKVIKSQNPNIQIVLGGYAISNPVGLNILKAFPFIDAIAEGDGEVLIKELSYASIDNYNLNEIKGVLNQKNLSKKNNPLQHIKLDNSSSPDYSDWFNDVKYLTKNNHVTINTNTLPIEASRGCWWGEHNHCIFCGIDDNSLKFRYKSPHIILSLLKELRDKYGNYTFRFSDYILPKHYYKTVLKSLSKEKYPYKLLGEIKANQSLKQIQQLSKAGYIEVQPGIESFSSEVLKLMNKGVTGIQNVLTIKGGYLYSIVINYNILYGIPNEKARWYLQMLKQLPSIYHFIPPVSRTKTVVTRYAPLQTNPNKFNLYKKAKHHHSYDVLFSKNFLKKTNFSYDDYCYYFEKNFEYPKKLDTLYSMLILQVDHWKKQHRERDVYLYYKQDHKTLLFYDTRFKKDPDIYKISGLTKIIYLMSDREIILKKKLLEKLSLSKNYNIENIEKSISELEKKRLIWVEKDRILGVAIPFEIFKKYKKSSWITKKWLSLYC